MANPRMTGLLLMGVSILAFLGTTPSAGSILPPVTFFPALVLFGIGAVQFLRSNHKAMERAETRARKAVNPVLKQNRHAEAHAERQARRQGASLSHVGADAAPLATNRAQRAPIELTASEADFVVDPDVSFPVEVQTGDALADQLHKLKLLLEQGVLTEEEYAVAKAKLLD